MSTSKLPLTASDLTHIAKRLAEWERLFVAPDGYKDRADLIARIEVIRPFSDDDVIGHFVLYDGWVGFQFSEATK